MLRSIFFASCFAALASVPFAACGGSTSNGGGGSGGGSVTGSVGGISLAVADAVAFADGHHTVGVDAKEVFVELFDISNVCALAQTFPSGAEKASYTGLIISFAQLGGAPIAPGTYNVGATLLGPDAGPLGARAGAALSKNDAQCKSQVPSGTGGATSGTATITTISANAVTGTFNLTFSQGTLQGSFTAGVCNLPDAGANPPTDGGATCIQ
jgi:hypothetical protein